MAVEDRAISDDELLAVVCARSADADAAAIRARLERWRGVHLDLAELEQRLEQLSRAGLVRRFQPHAAAALQFHLTEMGVQRLLGLEHKPTR